MNRIKKRIIVRFFSIKANDSFFEDFISIQNANQASEKSVRIVNVRDKKHLIKIHDEFQYQDKSTFLITVVRERNTWQTRALKNGSISGIPLNQGIIGDPYYFYVIPRSKIVLGFTTGLSGSLKSTGNSILQQFNKDRTSTVTLEPVSKSGEFSKLKKLNGYNKLHFKVSANSLDESNEDAPELLRQLSAAPFMPINSEIALTFTEIGKNGFSENDLIDIVSYLSENDGCKALTVEGLDNNGLKVNLHFSKAYAIFKTEVEVRNKFIDEKKAQEILLNALISLDISKLLVS